MYPIELPRSLPLSNSGRVAHELLGSRKCGVPWCSPSALEILHPDEMHKIELRPSQAIDRLSGDASADSPEAIGIRSGHPLRST